MFQWQSLPSPRQPIAAATMVAITMIGAGVAGWLRDREEAAAPPCAEPRSPRAAPEPPSPPPATRAEPELVVPDCPDHPYPWSAIRGQTHNAELIALASFQSTSTEPGQGGSVRIDQVLLGPRPLEGVRIEYENLRWPFAAGDRVLIFVAPGTEGRWDPVFHGGLGLWKIGGDDRLVCPVGDSPDAGRPRVDEVVARIGAAARERARWSVRMPERVRLSDHVVRVTFTARNTGRVTVRVLPPTSYVHAPIDSDTASHVPFGEFLPDGSDRPVAIRPGRAATFHYDLLLADLGIRTPGVYRISARLLADDLDERAGAMPDQIWLGDMARREMSLRVVGR